MPAGPPICVKCELLYTYDCGGAIRWCCPKCGARRTNCKLYLYDLSKEEQDKYIDNSSAFRDAMKKKNHVH